MTDSPITPETVRNALEKATPGPWRLYTRDGSAHLRFVVGPYPRAYPLARIEPIPTKYQDDESIEANASLTAMAQDIAHAYLDAMEENARLRNARDDAIDTLDAWFDRRKLAHETIDETVLNAARGYLRTSRSGGMDNETSDMIEGVIADMARLSVFADLFARAYLHAKEQSDD